MKGFKSVRGSLSSATHAVMLAAPLAVDGYINEREERNINQTKSRSNFVRIKRNIIGHFEFVFDFKKTQKIQIENCDTYMFFHFVFWILFFNLFKSKFILIWK